MNQVFIISMPHNARGPLYQDDPNELDPETGEPYRGTKHAEDYWDLPIPMPATLVAITDQAGKPLALQADGRPIRKKDVLTVWRGVCQYNRDLARREAGEA